MEAIPLSKYLDNLELDYDRGEKLLLSILALEQNLKSEAQVLEHILSEIGQGIPPMGSKGDEIRMTRKRAETMGYRN